MDRLFYVAGALALIVGTSSYDWRLGCIICGVCCLIVAFILDFSGTRIGKGE